MLLLQQLSMMMQIETLNSFSLSRLPFFSLFSRFCMAVKISIECTMTEMINNWTFLIRLFDDLWLFHSFLRSTTTSVSVKHYWDAKWNSNQKLSIFIVGLVGRITHTRPETFWWYFNWTLSLFTRVRLLARAIRCVLFINHHHQHAQRVYSDMMLFWAVFFLCFVVLLPTQTNGRVQSRELQQFFR